MSNNSVCGTVHLIGETKEYGDNGFRKRQIVLVQSLGSRENFIPMELIQDMCEDADSLSIGTEVTIEYKLSGRKWISPDGDTKYFMNLEVTDIMDNEAAYAESMQDEPASMDEDEPF